MALFQLNTGVLASFKMAVIALIGLGAGYILYSVIYGFFFHPLRKYPGPKMSVLSRIPLSLEIISGESHKKVLDLHKKYGPVVRIAPDELSFSSPEAWNEIMGHKSQGKGENGKDPVFWATQPHSVIGANREDHRRMRRILAHGFSAQSMADQQPLIQGYVDLLIQRLHQNCKDGTEPINLMSWYNWTTFDVIGDLSFGQSFGCLDGSGYHPWVKFILDGVRTQVVATELRRYPLGALLLKWFMPQRLIDRVYRHKRLTQEKVAQRMKMEGTRPDFMDAMLRADGKQKLSLPEIEDNARILILAGSETTATTLTGVTYLLAAHPEVLAKLQDEVRSSFKSEDEIDLINVQHLHYMLAVLDESMRMYPPVPVPIPRVTQPGGDTICGRYVPEGTLLGIWQWPMYHNPENFAMPDSFVPERWLDDARFANDRKDALQPFNFGPRNCIGRNLAYAEMRMVLARVIWNFDIKLVRGTENWLDHKSYVLWDKPDYHVYLEPRTFATDA